MTDIKECIEFACSRGIRIVRRHQFAWDSDRHLYECDAIGAILFANNLAEPGFPKGWLTKICEITGKDTYWFWRFTQGWNYGHRLSITRKDKKTKEWITVVDKVSRFADDLAKKYT